MAHTIFLAMGWTGVVAMLVLVCMLSLDRAGVRPLEEVLFRFRQLPKSVRFLVAVLVLETVVFGGSKTPTNAPPLTSSAPLRTPSAGAGEFTSDERESGYALSRTGTGEVFSFDAPSNATVVSGWLAHGASDAWEPIGTNEMIFACGRVRRGNRVYGPQGMTFGVLPTCRWASCSDVSLTSRVWYAQTPTNSRLVTWQDVLFNRETDAPVSLQAEFYPDGNYCYRYDFSRLSESNALFASGVFATNTTSHFYHRVLPSYWREPDLDGDGLTSHSEVMTYHTSPELYDTDGDGLGDGAEIGRGSDPLDPDTDNDGIPDGGDPDPLTATVSTDADGDGLPDAYEVHWFGSADAVGDASVRARSGFTYQGLLATGQDPCREAADVFSDPTNQIGSILLWGCFAADRTSLGDDLVYERTVQIGRQNNWQQFYLSSRPSSAGGWSLEGMVLEWQDSDGTNGTLVASPSGDSVCLPLSTNNPSSVTFRLRATGPRVRSAVPVYLVTYAPKIVLNGGQDVDLPHGGTAVVCTDGSRSEVSVEIDRSQRPCRATLHPQERIMDGLDEIAEGRGCGPLVYHGDEWGGTLSAAAPGIYHMPESKIGALTVRRMMRASVPGGGTLLVVLDPMMWYGRHPCGDEGGVISIDSQYQREAEYPLSTPCLRREWHHGVNELRCACEPGISAGVEDALITARIDSDDGTDATGSILVGNAVVWSDTVRHYLFFKTFGGEGGCCRGGCAEGDCSSLEGPELGSLKFRIPLGSFRKGQVAGFAYFVCEGAALLSPSLFSVLPHPDVRVEDVSDANGRTVRCLAARGRDLQIATIENGVRVTISDHATQALEHLWEIVNVGGNVNTVRLRKISRLDNVMESWLFERVQDQASGAWRWQATNETTGLRESVEYEDDLNGSGEFRERRQKFDASGTLIGSLERELIRIGEREGARLCETYRREELGNSVVIRESTYWKDSQHPARNGLPKLQTATDRPWEYHEWDKNGLELLRVEQRNGSFVPQSFPTVAAGILLNATDLEDALVTVYDYTPLAGDDNCPDDFGKVRCETRSVVRHGVQTVVGRTWFRYTHGTHSAYPTRKEEVWRASSAAAGFQSPGNAYSHRTVLTLDGITPVPFALHGRQVEQLDENGVLTTVDVVSDGDEVSLTTRRARLSSTPVSFPTYVVEVLDAVHGNVLRTATCLSESDAMIEEVRSVYDDQDRLRFQSYLDGSSLTNAYSCCRKLWSIDREGRRVLRSAVTGEDMLYWAEEDVWLREIATNGIHRVTQHFCDGFGRETNTVVCLATSEGQATDSAFSEDSRLCEDRVAYADMSGNASVEEGCSGKRTSRQKYESSDHTWEMVVESDDAGHELTEQTETVRNGPVLTRRSWNGVWTERRRLEDYDAAGCRTVVEVTRASDYPVVTNVVERYDFLGRLVSRKTPTDVVFHAYEGSTGRMTTETTVADGRQQVVTRLYDERGEEIGTLAGGVTNRTETDYELRSNDWWRVVRMSESADGRETVQTSCTRLTGLGNGLRLQNVSIDVHGVETELRIEEGDAVGELVETETSSLRSPTVRRTRFGLLMSEQTAEGTTSYAYDALGQVVAIEENGKWTGCEYDACGRVIRVRQGRSDGMAEVRCAYDAFDRRTIIIDAQGAATTNEYDSAGRLVAVSGADRLERSGYDTEGRRTSLRTTRDGIQWDETRWTYDPATGNCLEKRYADGSAVRYSYAPDGRLEETLLPSGKERSCSYDGQGRLSSVESSDGRQDAVFGYDPFGRTISVSGAVATCSRTFSSSGVVTNEVVSVDGKTFVVTRTLDGSGRITGRGLSGLGSTVYQAIGYDEENRIASMTDARAIVEYDYTAGGEDAGFVLTLAGGATIVREVVRDPHTGRIVSVSNRVNGVLVDGHVYVRDAMGRIVRHNDDVFGYDERGQVVSQMSLTSQAAQAYSYDLAGNRPSCLPNELNQYVQADSEALSYTADGELSHYRGLDLAYDSAGRLATVSTGGVQLAAYDYDEQGRRVRKTTPEAETVFVYDGWNLLAERTTRGDVVETVDYAWGKDVEGSLSSAGGIGALLSVRVNGTVYVPLYDGNGNVTAYVTQDGTPIVRFSYDAFGNVTEQDCGQVTVAELARLHFRYSTKYADTETGFCYYGLRYYAPSLGRWISRDPLGETDHDNLYVFCQNAPTWQYDALGELTKDECDRHYKDGTGTPLEMPFSDVNTSDVRPDRFPAVQRRLDGCKEGVYDIRYESREDNYAYKTHDRTTDVLGVITLKLEGRLTIDEKGDWEFDGTLKSFDDEYDFRLDTRIFRDFCTLGGRPWSSGVPFWIEIRGSKHLSGSGNCCQYHMPKHHWWDDYLSL